MISRLLSPVRIQIKPQCSRDFYYTKFIFFSNTSLRANYQTKYQNDPVPSSRQLAFKSMRKLQSLIDEGRLEEACFSVMRRTDVTIFSRSPSSQKYYDSIGLKFKSELKYDDRRGFKPLASAATKRPPVWNIVIKSLSKHGLWKESHKVYREMLRQRVCPVPETFTSLLLACANSLRNSSPKSKEPQYKFNNPAYKYALKIYRDIESKSTHDLNRIHVNTLLRCASLANDWQAVFALYRKMNWVDSDIRKAQSMEFDDYLRLKTKKITAELAIASSNSDYVESFDYLEKSLEKASNLKIHLIRPDFITYSILLSACANRQGDAAVQDALIIWNDLKNDLMASRQNTSNLRKHIIASQKLSSSEKNSKTKRNERYFDQEEVKKLKDLEDIRNQLDEDLPLISLDTDLINTMLFACGKADSKKLASYALKLATEEFGSAFNWIEFDHYFSQCVDSKSNEAISSVIKEAEIRNNSKNNYDVASNPTPLVPNAKTLSILMNIMHKKLSIPVDVLVELYKFMTQPTGSGHRFYQTISPDGALDSFYLQLMVEAKQFGNFFNVFDELSSKRKKRIVKNKKQRKERGINITHLPPQAYQNLMKVCLILSDEEKNSMKYAQKYWKHIEHLVDRETKYSYGEVSKNLAYLQFYPTGYTFIYYIMLHNKLQTHQHIWGIVYEKIFADSPSRKAWEKTRKELIKNKIFWPNIVKYIVNIEV